MANIETNDFSEDFDRDFRDDVTFIADRANDILDELDRKYGGQLEEINRNFSDFRNDFLTLLETMVGTEVLDRRGNLDDIIGDAVLAATAVCAKTIRRGGNRDADDWIEGEFENNPMLRELSRSSRGGRDRGRDRGRSSRYSERRSAADYHARRERPAQSRGNRDEGRRTSRRRPSSNQDVPRGRIAAITKPRKEEVVEEVKQETTSPRSTRTVAPKPLQPGTVVISENFAQTDLAYGLLYVAGDEQTVYTGTTLEVEEFTGANEVDYQKHRIDLFYPDILGDQNKTDLTAVAIREAEKVRDQTIKAFIKDPSKPDAELVSDPKLFQHAISGSYEETMKTYSKSFSHVDIRESLVEEHSGTFEWFTKHALFVRAEQIIKLDDMSNDVVIRLKKFIEQEKMLETVGGLIELSSYLDPMVWRLLHDYLTVGFNKRLISLDLPIILSSISADWNEFREWLKNNRPELSETLNNKLGIINGLEVRQEEGQDPELVLRRDTLFIPVSSYDLDFAAATAKEGFAVLNEQSKIFKFVNELMANGSPVLYITTLDGQTMAARDISGVMGCRYFITKE